MRTFLARRWFLLLLLWGAVLVWLWPGALGWTRLLDPALAGAVAVFLSAWSLESRRLLGTLLRPWPALWAVAISSGLLPALAWALTFLLPQADLRLGLLLIASVPCTLASAVIWTRLAAGNEATALLVTFLTNMTGWLTTTAWLLAGVGAAAELEAGPIMGKLLLVLVLPVGLGQLLRGAGPLARAATRHRFGLSVAARLLTLTIMLKAAVEVRDRLDLGETPVNGWLLLLAALLCLVTHLGALAAGLASSRSLGFDRPDSIAVALAGSQKTLPVALILFDAYFTAYPLAVVPLVFFHVGQLVVDTFIAEWLAARQPPEMPAAADPAPEAAV
jgi:solute carrier family 10 (sodium/bile acid cotransporter), member 7